MNTQKYGIYSFTRIDRLHDILRWQTGIAVADYTRNRTNGDEKWDIPDHQFPKDGHYNWIKGEERDGRVYGELQEDGRYAYEVRYDEGPGDRAWMEERDRKYVFRLEREGKLDHYEPNLWTDVPMLFAEVMKYRTERGTEVEAKVKTNSQRQSDAERKKEEAEKKARLRTQEEAERRRKEEKARLAAIDAKVSIEAEPQKEELEEKEKQEEWKKSVKMKNGTFGLSPNKGTKSGNLTPPSNWSRSHTAVANYRENRENGEKEDEPNDKFPNDGKYEWNTLNEDDSYIRYTEGDGDKKWMEEKDHNYLKRIAREGTAEKRTQLAQEVQGGRYEQYFADERSKFEEEQKKLEEQKKKLSVNRKPRFWGLSIQQLKIRPFYILFHSLNDPPHSYNINIEAIDNYRKNRETGDDRDNPSCEFPNDGEYSWETPDKEWSKVRYTEGPKDQAWMEEKDQNYLKRISQTGSIEEKEQLAEYFLPYEQEIVVYETQNKIQNTAINDNHTIQKTANEKNTQLKNTEQELNQQTEQIELLNKQLQTKNQEVTQNQEEIKKLQDQQEQNNMEFQEQLQEKDTKITDLQQDLSTLEKSFNEVKIEAEQIVAAVTERKTEVEPIQQMPQETTDFLTQFKTLMESKNEWQTDENLNLEKRLAEIQQDQQKQAEALDKNRNDLQAQIKELKENQVEDRTVQAQQNIALHCLEAKIETLETRYEVKNIQKLIDNIRKEFSKQLDTEDKKYQLLFKKEREKVWSALTRDIEEKEEKHMEKIVDLEIKLDCLKENESQQTEEIKKIEAELTQVHTGQECLMQDYRIKQKLLAEQREICRYPELRYFYQCVQLKLVEVFLATKSIASGMIDAPVSLKVQGAQKVIELAGEVVPIPGAGAAGGLLSSGLGFFAQKKSEKKKQLQSSLLGTMNDIEIVAESVARSLTHRYTEQLLQLTPEGSRLLGECAIARMINYLEDHLDLLAYGAEPEQAKSNLVTSLLSSLYRVKMKQKYWGICNRDIPTKEGGLNWTESGILTEPGIRCVFQTPSGQREERYYGSGKKEIRLKPGPDAKINFSIKTRPEKYGYRRGTVREAEDLRLSWSPHRGPQRAEHLMQLKFHEQLSQLLREGTTEEKHELIDQLASRHQQSPPSPW